MRAWGRVYLPKNTPTLQYYNNLVTENAFSAHDQNVIIVCCGEKRTLCGRTGGHSLGVVLRPCLLGQEFPLRLLFLELL